MLRIVASSIVAMIGAAVGGLVASVLGFPMPYPLISAGSAFVSVFILAFTSLRGEE